MQNSKTIDISAKKLILVAITGMIVLTFSDVPFIKLLLNTQTLLFIIWLIAVFSFAIKSKIMLLSFFILIFYCLVLTLLGQSKEAQAWGDWSFPVLVIALAKYFLENRNEIQSS